MRQGNSRDRLIPPVALRMAAAYLLATSGLLLAQPIEAVLEWGGVNTPQRIAANSSHVFVTEPDGTIKKFDHDGLLVREWTIPSQAALAIDIGPGGLIYIAPPSGGRIYKYTEEGDLVDSFIADGLQAMYDLALDKNGTIYAISFTKVFKVSQDGELLTSWGDTHGQPGFIYRASGIAVSPSGDVFVSDSDDETILHFDSYA